MKVAYTDSSCIIAIAFGESGYEQIARKLRRADGVFAHHLLEAELLAAAKREDVPGALFADLLNSVRLIFPERSLIRELGQVFSQSYLRGADALHLATALWLAGDRKKDMQFLSLDVKQAEVAERLGFST